MKCQTDQIPYMQGTRLWALNVDRGIWTSRSTPPGGTHLRTHRWDWGVELSLCMKVRKAGTVCWALQLQPLGLGPSTKCTWIKSPWTLVNGNYFKLYLTQEHFRPVPDLGNLWGFQKSLICLFLCRSFMYLFFYLHHFLSHSSLSIKCHITRSTCTLCAASQEP